MKTLGRFIIEKLVCLVLMSNYCDCADNEYVYRFSAQSNRLQFQAAKNRCKTDGGYLAQNLNRNNYQFLNTCCDNQDLYWIGLVADSTCRENRNGKYRWLRRQKCFNEPILSLPNPSMNNCQAVTLAIKSPNQNVPRPQVQDCTTAQRFICQYKKVTTIPTTAEVTTAATTTTKPKQIHTTSRAITATSSYNPVNTDSSNVNLEFLFGLLGGLALFLLLLIIVYCRFYKNCNLTKLKRLGKKKTNVSTRSATSNTSVQNQVYFSVEPTAVVYQSIDPPPDNYERAYEVIKSNAVENATYQCAVELENDGYQKLDDPSNKQNPDGKHHYENDRGDEYNKLYLHPRASTRKSRKSSVKEKPDNPYATAEEAQQNGSETVEYTTIRCVNEPTDVYATVDKSKPNK